MIAQKKAGQMSGLLF